MSAGTAAAKLPNSRATDKASVQASNTWFVTLKGQQKGPFSSEQLRDLVGRGQIHEDTLVRRGDRPSAVPAGQIRGLLALGASSVPAPAQPLAAPTAVTRRQRGARASQSDASRVMREVSASDEQPEEDISHGRAIPGRAIAGRATASQRFQSIVIDLLVIGGLAVALVVYSLVLPQRSVAALSADIDAARATQSARQVADRGEPRPRLADWPTLAIEVQKRMVAKQALIEVEKATLAKPAPSMTPSRDQLLQETLVKNLENELVFLQKYYEFEDGRAVQDRAAVAAAATTVGPLQGILIGLALALVCFAAPICVHVSGGTPGHWLMGLRVVGPTRRPVGFRTSLLRHAGSLVPWSHAALLSGPAARARHDDWSRTEVVSRAAVVHGRASAIQGEKSKGLTSSTTRLARPSG